MLKARTSVIAALLAVFFITTGCGGQRRDNEANSSAADPPRATATTPPALAKAPAREHTADRTCEEKPTPPQFLRDREYGRLLFKEFDALYETGRFGLGYCVAEVEVNEEGTVEAVHLVRPRPLDERLNQAITKTQAARRYKPALACGLPVKFMLTVGIGHCPVPMNEKRWPPAALVVRASSTTAGPDGVVWLLDIGKDGSALVRSSSEFGAKSQEQRFTVDAPERQAIVRASDEARYFELPDSVGPSDLPVHGPLNTLEIRYGGRVRKVYLSDPTNAHGDDVRRFRLVWDAIAALSGIKPPL